jgi:hypothetical protein
MVNIVLDSFKKLKRHIEKENFIGYDPYDILNSKIPFKYLGKWAGAILTQIHKRNPVNIRPLLGIKKEVNPKAYGLFLQAYCILYTKTGEKDYLYKADYFFNYLRDNYSKGYSGYAWGYNFPWVSPVKFVEPFVPSSVVTGFICRGLWQYYEITKNPEAAEIIKSTSCFILKDLSVYSDNTGKCISYAPQKQYICYNSSLLAAEILAINYCITPDNFLKDFCIELVNFVLARQKPDGRWSYSESVRTGNERNQIDFHQGYILESIFEIQKFLNIKDAKWDNALELGLDFYYNYQFFKNGRSLWRLPKEYPVDIHNQSQGIITFINLQKFNQKYREFSNTIFEWTVNNMQDNEGYFYFKNYKYFKDKTSYIRWGQAWMFLAIAKLISVANY